MQTHQLKLQTPFFDAVKDGSKTFEIRENDRGYQTGDLLEFKRFANGRYTDGEEPLLRRITYMLSGWGLKAGFVVLGIGPEHPENAEVLGTTTELNGDEHPIQQIVLDEKGRARFRENTVVRAVFDNCKFDMNTLNALFFSDDDRRQFAQLIGYSTSGYGELPYTEGHWTVAHADAVTETLLNAAEDKP